MATKYLDENGLLYLWQKIRNTFVSDVTWDSTNKKLVKKKKTGTNGAEQSSDIVTFSSVATSGSYNDLTNKPTIPTYSDFVGATSSTDGTHGLVPAPSRNSTERRLYDVLVANGGWQPMTLGSSMTTGNTDSYSITLKASTQTLSTVDVPMAASNSCGMMTHQDKTKLDGIASGAEVNVNADWNSSSGDSQILNKPTLGAAAAKGVVTTISADSTDLPTVTAVKGYVETAVSGGAAFQGTAPTTFAPTNYKAGYYWVVGTAGTYVGETCEAGDMIFATQNYNSAYSASDFDVIQTNLDITSISNAEIDTIVAA